MTWLSDALLAWLNERERVLKVPPVDFDEPTGHELVTLRRTMHR